MIVTACFLSLSANQILPVWLNPYCFWKPEIYICGYMLFVSIRYLPVWLVLGWLHLIGDIWQLLNGLLVLPYTVAWNQTETQMFIFSLFNTLYLERSLSPTLTSVYELHFKITWYIKKLFGKKKYIVSFIMYSVYWDEREKFFATTNASKGLDNVENTAGVAMLRFTYCTLGWHQCKM